MRIFSTFTGIGGFEIGIQNAYRSTHGRGQADSTRDKRERLLATARENTNTTGGQPSASTSNETDARPLHFGGEPLPALKQIGQRGYGVADERAHNVLFGHQPPLCVGYSEIDRYAIEIYEKHFEGVKNYGDITKINADELPDFDCLVGGFPCQAFSIAGKRGGFEDTRGTLFFDLARILRAKRPRLFVFENVKGLLSHDGGNTFRTIVAAITDLGYDCQWQVLNSKNHGVPQNRERIIIVGNLRGTPRPEVFPIFEDSYAPVSAQSTSTALDANYWKGIDNHGARTSIVKINQPVHSTNRVYSPEGIGPALGTMQGGGRQPYVALSGNGDSTGKEANTDGVREASGIPRRLDVMSDTQRYKMAGNAVTTKVIQAVFERIFA